MTLVVVVLVVIVLGLLALLYHQRRELEQRDAHLAWVDRRDQKLIELFRAASLAVKVPKSNPIEPWMQHGMVSKNAIAKAPELFPMLAERIDVLNKVLSPISGAVKAVENWEKRNPAPPISRDKIAAAMRKGELS
jgi:hypothetical protein